MRKFLIIAILWMLLISCQKSKESNQINQKENSSQTKSSQQNLKYRKESNIIPIPLTSEEQEFFEKIGGRIIFSEQLDKLNNKELIKYLRVLVNGTPETIEWYKKHPDTKERQKDDYEQAIGEAFAKLDPTDKEVISLSKQILTTKMDYTDAIGYAIDSLGRSGDKSALPLLKKYTNSPDLAIVTAGALLSLDETELSFPIIDKYAKEGVPAAIIVLVYSGKARTERGIEILKRTITEKSLSNYHAETKMFAARYLYKIGVETDKCEEAALRIIKQLYKKERTDYGFDVVGDSKNSKTILLPGYEDKKLEDLKIKFHSDGRACSYACWLLGELKSKQAVPLLEYIQKNNTDTKYVCWENAADRAAESALQKIRGDY